MPDSLTRLIGGAAGIKSLIGIVSQPGCAGRRSLRLFHRRFSKVVPGTGFLAVHPPHWDKGVEFPPYTSPRQRSSRSGHHRKTPAINAKVFGIEKYARNDPDPHEDDCTLLPQVHGLDYIRVSLLVSG